VLFIVWCILCRWFNIMFYTFFVYIWLRVWRLCLPHFWFGYSIVYFPVLSILWYLILRLYITTSSKSKICKVICYMYRPSNSSWQTTNTFIIHIRMREPIIEFMTRRLRKPVWSKGEDNKMKSFWLQALNFANFYCIIICEKRSL
jgi:hypothetical protein